MTDPRDIGDRGDSGGREAGGDDPLADLLRRAAPDPLADGGFTDRVLRALPRAPARSATSRAPGGARPAPAGWLAPAEAARRAAAARTHRAHLRRWTQAGLAVGTGIAAVALGAQALGHAGAVSVAEGAVASTVAGAVAIPWLSVIAWLPVTAALAGWLGLTLREA